MTDAPTDEVLVGRVPDRAAYDAAAIAEILDDGWVAHVGTVRAGKPVVIPMYYVRDGDSLLLHGSNAAGTLRRGKGADVCVTVTLLDALVLARSSFHHSMNYRSVVVIGQAMPVEDPDEKVAALELFVERMVAGRQAMLRPTTDKELKATMVLRLPLEQASAKVRNGPPIDDDEDYELRIWAGLVPLTSQFGVPIGDGRSPDGTEQPANVTALLSD